MANKLGIIAGSGPLPKRIIDACRAAGRPYFVVAFLGETDPETVAGEDHITLGLGQLGETIKQLHRAGCDELVMAGPVNRPSLKNLKLDLRAMKLMGKLTKAMGQGDNAVLSLLVGEFEAEGFRVVGADEVLGEGATAPAGVMGRHHPDETSREDIAFGVRIAQALGTLDVGQAVIVQHQIVLGVEAIEGTDALIERCGGLRREGAGGVLVKLKKPHQERRADLPTIGLRTIDKAAQAGLAGIAVQAGETLMMDPKAIIAAADAAGLFVIGLDDL